jgi:hypothetical protein
LAIGAAEAVRQIRTQHLPGSTWIGSWYDEAYESGGKHLVRGDDYVSWAQTGGAILCGLGILALLIAFMNGGKRKAR